MIIAKGNYIPVLPGSNRMCSEVFILLSFLKIARRGTFVSQLQLSEPCSQTNVEDVGRDAILHEFVQNLTSFARPTWPNPGLTH